MYVAIRVGDDVPAAFALSTTQRTRLGEVDIDLAKASPIKPASPFGRQSFIRRPNRRRRAKRSSPFDDADSRFVEFVGSAHHGDAGIGSRVVGVASASISFEREEFGSPLEHDITPDVLSVKKFQINCDDPIGRRLSVRAGR